MITRNADYTIQRLRGLSTDTKPTDVPNGSEFREMDTGKDFMYDADNESWEEQPKKGGGGGGSGDTIPGVSLIRNITLEEPVRAIEIDIPAGYDWVYLLLDGGFATENWVYTDINGESVNYYAPKSTTPKIGEAATVIGDRYIYFVPTNGSPYMTSASKAGSSIESITLKGYSDDFIVGTRVVVFGGKYANL